MTQHKIVSRDEWVEARMQFLSKEKELTRARDRLSEERRSLPWVKIENDYVFEGPDGKETLLDLFGGNSQLIIYHFMFGPGWEEGCKACSFVADHIDGAVVHLAQRDATLLAVSRAPLAEFQAFKERMGWRFKWVSSNGSDFNFDFNVSFSSEQLESGKVNYNYKSGEFPMEEAPGASVFSRNEAGEIFHTYSCYGRGLDSLIGSYTYLDLLPKGRDEGELSFPMAWVRHHDSYGSSND